MRFAGRTCAVAVIVSSFTWSTPSHAQPSLQFAEPPATSTPAPPGSRRRPPSPIRPGMPSRAPTSRSIPARASPAVRSVGFDDTTVTLLLQGGVLKTLAREDIRDVRVEDARAVDAANRSRSDSTNGEHRGTGRIISGKVITSGRRRDDGIGPHHGDRGPGRADGRSGAGHGVVDDVGAVHLAVGIPLLVSGTRARQQYDRRMEERGRYGRLRLAPVAAPVRGGAVAGLSLSF